MEEINCLVFFGWRDKISDELLEFLEKAVGKKKILALGSAANLLSEYLGSTFEILEEVPPPELGVVEF